MKKSVVLIVIYNHNFEKNIDKIKAIYGSRFSKIIQLMPFYRGNDPNVVGVYEASWQFNGYLAQALPRILREQDCSHYLIIGDDLLLHPELNEYNVCEKLGLDENCAFSTLVELINEKHFETWSWTPYVYEQFVRPYNRCEAQRFLPTLQEARAFCSKHAFDWTRGLSASVTYLSQEEFQRKRNARGWRRRFRQMERSIRCKLWLKTLWNILRGRDETQENLLTEPYYPLFRGFSDMVVIPAHKMADFAHLSGVFAAMRLFVEVGIPTGLVFTMDKIKTEKDIPYRCIRVWNENRTSMMERYGCALSRLYEVWPEDVLYYHPVKLSQWTVDI